MLGDDNLITSYKNENDIKRRGLHHKPSNSVINNNDCVLEEPGKHNFKVKRMSMHNLMNIIKVQKVKKYIDIQNKDIYEQLIKEIEKPIAEMDNKKKDEIIEQDVMNKQTINKDLDVSVKFFIKFLFRKLY